MSEPTLRYVEVILSRWRAGDSWETLARDYDPHEINVIRAAVEAEREVERGMSEPTPEERAERLFRSKCHSDSHFFYTAPAIACHECENGEEVVAAVIRAAVETERERCAKVATLVLHSDDDVPIDTCRCVACACSTAIRRTEES